MPAIIFQDTLFVLFIDLRLFFLKVFIGLMT